MARKLTVPPVAPYRPAPWLPNPHLATMWGKFFRRVAPVTARMERWDTPDGDFVDLVRTEGEEGAPTFLFLHGLEGSVRSHYAAGTLAEAARRGWQANLLIFRTCGDTLNRAPRSYHSGETTDLDFVARRLRRERPGAPLLVAGVSLGGNVVLKWLGELGNAALTRRLAGDGDGDATGTAAGDAAANATGNAAGNAVRTAADSSPRGERLPPAASAPPPLDVTAAVAVSVPFDLARSCAHIEHGFARVYGWNFLRSLRRKALAKIAQHPGIADPDRVRRARTLWEFDDAFTSVVHGFRDAADYYLHSSSIRYLEHIRVPTLLLSARDDPFHPAGVLDDVRRIATSNPALALEFTDRGGHVGFVEGAVPWRTANYAERRIGDFLYARVAGR